MMNVMSIILDSVITFKTILFLKYELASLLFFFKANHIVRSSGLKSFIIKVSGMNEGLNEGKLVEIKSGQGRGFPG